MNISPTANFGMKEKPKLLAVDDEQDNLDLISRSLRKDYEVITSTSPEKALAFFEKNDFSVILSDQRMPGMTGTEFLHETFKRQPGAVRILITGYSDIDSVIDAINRGSVHRYVKKPWTREELQQEISIAVQLQSLITENQEMVKLLRETNQKLSEQQKLLMMSLDERSRDLYRLNTELQKLNEQLLGQSKRDGLTGLLNHKTFQERLKEEMAFAKENGSPLSLIFLDVDNFKNYNDKHGHQAGDLLLRSMATLLTQTSRITTLPSRELVDTVGRYGGEEFAIILPNTPAEGALVKAERTRQSISEYPFPNSEEQPLGCISVSVGVASFPADAQTAEELIQHADTAMYLSKNAGRNRVTVYADLKKTP